MGFFEIHQGLPAFIAKLGAQCIGISTLRAGEFQFIPTLFAKLRSFTILKLTFRAFHLGCPPGLKKYCFER
jgi:hypothetical protein